MAAQHTILLAQTNKLKSSKTWRAFDSVGMCMESLLSGYEAHLKESDPTTKAVTYDLEDLFKFYDKYPELVALVFSANTQSYVPRDSDWLKDKLKSHLQQAMAHSK